MGISVQLATDFADELIACQPTASESVVRHGKWLHAVEQLDKIVHEFCPAFQTKHHCSFRIYIMRQCKGIDQLLREVL